MYYMIINNKFKMEIIIEIGRDCVCFYRLFKSLLYYYLGCFLS